MFHRSWLDFGGYEKNRLNLLNKYSANMYSFRKATFYLAKVLN